MPRGHLSTRRAIRGHAGGFALVRRPCWSLTAPPSLFPLDLACRYDDLKTAQENIDLQSTILSRFDLIFIVKDTREHDMAIARHVLDNHRQGAMAGARGGRGAAGGLAGGPGGGESQEAQEVEFLKRYIHYCRSQCSPRVNEEAAKRLAAFYVEIRNEVSRSMMRGPAACV